jgi:predicted DNA-binding protein with PD1-like motif
MQFKRLGERVQVRFERSERVDQPLVEWLAREGIGYAAISGLGAVSSATVSYWNAETKQYEPHQLNEQMEVVSLIGNVTLKEGQPFLHIHVTLGRRDLSIIGGHFNDATVNPNLELWLRPEDEPIRRGFDEACGLYVMQLPERQEPQNDKT